MIESWTESNQLIINLFKYLRSEMSTEPIGQSLFRLPWFDYGIICVENESYIDRMRDFAWVYK